MALVCLARYSDAVEAETARGVLDANGLYAVVFDGDFAQTAWHLSTAIGGVRLMVPEEEAAAARRLLEMPAPEDGEFDAIDACPKCGGQDIAQLFDAWWSLPLSVLFGMIFLFRRTRRHCRGCGHDWRIGSVSQ